MRKSANEIYCFHCRKFHPVPFETTKDSLLGYHSDWRCPLCGNSVLELYSEIQAMPAGDRKFCYVNRRRKVKCTYAEWEEFHIHTAKHPLLFDYGMTLIIFLLIVILAPVAFYCSTLLLPAFIVVGFTILFFAPWHTGGFF